MVSSKQTVEVPTEEAPRKRGRPKGSTKSTNSDRDKISRAKAIRIFCEECMGYQVFLIKDCPAPQCPLWPFRTGRGQQHTDVPINGKDYVRPRDN